MQIGYTRAAKSLPSIRQQREALGAAGFDLTDEHVPIFEGDARAFAIASMEPGDVLVVMTPACLGGSVLDVVGALSDVGRRGGSVLDLESGRAVSLTEGEIEALDFAMRAEGAIRKATSAIARKARAESGNLGGKARVEWTPTKVAKLRAMFEARESRAAMMEEFGCSRPTIQRKLVALGLIH